MATMPEHPRDIDEWRVVVDLDAEEHGRTLGARLHTLSLDDEARRRLGGSVIVTREGLRLFLYAWHEPSAREAERVVRKLLDDEQLSGQVELQRWHPIEDAWKPASMPLPGSDVERIEERRRHGIAEAQEAAQTGRHDWEVVIELPHLRQTLELGRELERRGLPVKRRWRYLIVGVLTEEGAVALGRELESEVPEGSRVGIRVNPAEGPPHPVFVRLRALEPEALRDLGR